MWNIFLFHYSLLIEFIKIKQKIKIEIIIIFFFRCYSPMAMDHLNSTTVHRSLNMKWWWRWCVVCMLEAMIVWNTHHILTDRSDRTECSIKYAVPIFFFLFLCCCCIDSQLLYSINPLTLSTPFRLNRFWLALIIKRFIF